MKTLLTIALTLLAVAAYQHPSETQKLAHKIEVKIRTIVLAVVE